MLEVTINMSSMGMRAAMAHHTHAYSPSTAEVGEKSRDGKEPRKQIPPLTMNEDRGNVGHTRCVDWVRMKCL